MKRYTALQHGLILLAMTAMAHTAHASPSPSFNVQNWISNDCISYHIMNSGNSSVLRQIEARCPAGNASNLFTGGSLLEYRVGETSHGLSEHLRLSREMEDFSDFIESISGPSRFSSNQTSTTASGRNAGEAYGNIGVWGNVSNASLNDTFVNTPFDSSSRNGTIGADVLVNDRFIVGAAFGYEDGNVDTLLNTGHQDINGYTISGYAATLLGRHFSIDGNLGYTNTDIDQTRLVSAFEVAAGTPWPAPAPAPPPAVAWIRIAGSLPST